mmetsp:Transcript_11626/g.18627  ORF Transcript_11626/g.18627 Transcript_11626/m.18627 type:complete len:210 (+) Transcript_11626:43-672(+)
MSGGDFQDVYCWIDEIPLSRPKKNIARDFSDAVLLSEVVHHFFPAKVDLHNYISTNAMSKKTVNWNTLNRKVLRKLFKFEIPSDEIRKIVTCQKGAIERCLQGLKAKIEAKKRSTEQKVSRPKKSVREQKGTSGARIAASTQPRMAMQGGAGGRAQVFPNAQSLLDEKDNTIEDLRETVAILQMKVQKLEQLLRLKDKKIEQLQGGSRR